MNIKSIAYASSLLFLSSAAFADPCDPRLFTIQDIESVSYSDVLALSAIDLIDASNEQSSNSNLNSSLLIKGTPVNLSLGSMRRIADYIKRDSRLNIDRDTKINFFRTNSSVGERMYKACLEQRTKEFDVYVPINASTAKEFIITMKWTPQSKDNTRNETLAYLNVTNAKVKASGVENAKYDEEASQKIKRGESVDFRVKRDDSRELIQISPKIDGLPLGETNRHIILPPSFRLNYVMRRKTFPAPGQPAIGKVERGDSGSPWGNHEWTDTGCITTENGLLLKETVAVRYSGSNQKPLVQTINDGSICYTYGVYGEDTFGKKGYSMMEIFSFSVLEVVPEGTQ